MSNKRSAYSWKNSDIQIPVLLMNVEDGEMIQSLLENDAVSDVYFTIDFTNTIPSSEIVQWQLWMTSYCDSTASCEKQLAFVSVFQRI